MILEVKRTFEPIGMNSEWEQNSYTITVWSFDSLTDTTTVNPVKNLKDFVPGLLKCFKDYRPINVIEFDEELEKIKWTRSDISKAINA